MGTRNLTMVIYKGETKVAQYGQWDGYPEGQGKTALEFLRGVDIDKFKFRLDSLTWLTKEQSEEIEKLPDGLWQKYHPYLSRDRGADILNLIMYNKYSSGRDEVKFGGEIVGLVNESDFAGDSLSNEWTYVIDLDNNTFEVFEGFNTSPLQEGERFFNLKNEYKGSSATYYAVKHSKTYSLNDLPTVDEFIKHFEYKEEES